MDVSIGYLGPVKRFMDDQGGDSEALFLDADISADMRDDTGARLPVQTFIKLLLTLQSLYAVNDLGLQLGTRAEINTYHILGISMMTCSDLHEALDNLLRYQHLAGSMGLIQFETGKECQEAKLSWLPRSDIITRHAAEFTLAGWVKFTRSIAGQDLIPNWVSFTHNAPDNLIKYTEFFRCELRFDQAENAMGFDPKYLHRPVLNADESVNLILQERIIALDKEMSDIKLTLPERVSLLVERSIQTGRKLSIDKVAQQLNQSSRALQRGLLEHGMSYSVILDSVRRTKVKEYLDAGLPLADTAYMLGYSDQSAFNRAFKKWWQCSPTEYINRY